MLDLYPARAFDLLPKPLSTEHSNPWISGATFEEDFIFVAEFSEIEGPKPLMTIPFDGGGTFDQNAFAIRILSADYHNSVSTEFRPVRDTQVVLSQVQEGAVAYVHYFTLYDIHARGFVRPFCVSYVTADKTKITKNFEELRNAFLEVLKHFKYRNLKLFTSDLESRVSHVKGDNDVDSVGSCSNSFTNSSSCRSFDLKLRTLQELCNWKNDEGIDLVRLVHRHFSRDSLVLMLEKRHLFLLKPTAGLLTFGGCMALNVLGTTSDMFNKDQNTFGCKSGADDHRYSVDSSDNSSDDSDIEVLADNAQCSSPTNLEHVTVHIQHLIKALSDQNSKGHTSLNSDYYRSESFSSQGDAMGNGDLRSTSRLPKQLPEESFESGDSFQICTPNSSWWNSGMECFYRNTANISPVSFQQDGTSLSSSVDSCRQESVCDPQSPQSSQSLRSSQGGTLASKYWSLNADTANEFDMKCDRYTQLVLSGSMAKTLACKLHRTHCIAVANFTDQCFRLTKVTPGYGIRHFLNHFSFSVHMIYCLLSGRPLLVVGPETMEAEVRATVLTLSMFVPGNNVSKSVIPWYTRKLKLGDLGYFRLVGLCVNEVDSIDSRMSPTVRQYVSIFHYQNKTLKTPRYSGKLLNCLSEKRGFKTDGALITFLQTLLCELSLKAFLYFHTFCAQLSPSSKIDLAAQPDRKTVVAFLNKTGVSGSDVDIVQYLGEVVKLQLKDEHFSTLNLREDSNQLPDMTISSRRSSRERCTVS